ncbi:MAG: metallophosphoesterase [Clostridiales bacterium]|jgi:hypothetical protein|nr:metallophosphoesterase [Clostridiales bacterium]
MKKFLAAITFLLTFLLVVFIAVKPTQDINSLPDEDTSFPIITDKSPSSAPPAYLPFTFSVLGDIHNNSTAFENALKDLNRLNSQSELLVLNGDIVDEGLDAQYNKITECLLKNSSLLPKTVVKNIGNHEFYNYAKGPNTPSDVDEFIARQLAFSNEKKTYHDLWIKDYHFISLGSEQSYTPELGSMQAYISIEQQKWLEEKLAEKHQLGRPIFVFLHQPLRSNTSGQMSNSAGSKQNDELMAILSKFPDVVFFSSHSHTFLDSNSMINFRQPFTAIHTGAVSNPLKIDEKGKRQSVPGSQGLVVELNRKKLVIRGRDFKNNSWIDGAVFSRDLK